MIDEKTGGKFGKWLRENPSMKVAKEPPKNESVQEQIARCIEQEKKDKKNRRRT